MSTEETLSVDQNMVILRAKSDSNVKELSSAIVAVVSEYYTKKIEIRAMGASSVNQALKAFIVAKTKVVAHGKNLLMDPYFLDVGEGEEKRTVICLRILIN
jgi:stage V sporulation protein SpoVS